MLLVALTKVKRVKFYSHPKKQRGIVEGVNFIKKSTRPSQENPNGGIVEKEASFTCFKCYGSSRMEILRVLVINYLMMVQKCEY